MFLVKSLQWKRLSCPSFVLKSAAGTQLCFTENEALKLWDELETCTLQAYVPPRANELRRCRVHWSLESSMRCVLYTQPVKPALCSSTTQMLGRKYNYASRLLRTSFSPHLPHPSLLQCRRLTHTFRAKSSTKQFLLSSPVAKEEPVPQLVAEQVQELVHFFNSNSKKYLE